MSRRANLLEDNPSLKEIFNTSNQYGQHQPRALAAAVYAYAAHIDDLSVLGSAVELIANKHASLYIQSEQYAVVGKYLLAAMKEVLGDALTPAGASRGLEGCIRTAGGRFNKKGRWPLQTCPWLDGLERFQDHKLLPRTGR